ncbi:MAG TPA: hypothetical protein VE955_09885 [Candidatus Dormibacteraeota bacterium]|nr:hypothetical protein [Candidatus Dormibacteraeota bacterium]
MEFEYIQLAPGFAREALTAYDSWNIKNEAPMKVQELMLVLRIEVSRLYKEETRPVEQVKRKSTKLKDTQLV